MVKSQTKKKQRQNPYMNGGYACIYIQLPFCYAKWNIYASFVQNICYRQVCMWLVVCGSCMPNGGKPFCERPDIHHLEMYIAYVPYISKRFTPPPTPLGWWGGGRAVDPSSIFQIQIPETKDMVASCFWKPTATAAAAASAAIAYK